MIYASGCHYSPLFQHSNARLFYILQLINRYAFCILNAYLPSEAMSLIPSIIFVAGTVETGAPFIVLKMCTCLWARDTRLCTDGIVDVQTT